MDLSPIELLLASSESVEGDYANDQQRVSGRPMAEWP